MQNSQNPTEKKFKAINDKTLKNHSEKNTIQKKFNRNYSVCQYLTNNEDIKEKLILIFPHFNEVINDKYEVNFNDDSNIMKIIFYYDKEVKNKKLLNLELLKFLINLIYYQEEKPTGYHHDLNKIFYLSYHLISRGFRCPFKILTNNTFNCDIVDIRNFYNYIIKNMYIDNFEKDVYTVKKNIGSCCCCLEEYEHDGFYIKCHCSVEICSNCFNNLTPRRCPICRYMGIYKNNNAERDISFKYNHQTKIFKTSKETCEEDVKLLFYNVDKKEIEEHYYDVDNDNDLIEQFYEDIDDRCIWYNSNFITDNILDIYKGIIDSEMVRTFQDNEKYEIVAKLLGFSHLSTEEIRQNKKKFFNNAVAIEDEGYKSVFNLEYYKGICENTNNKHEYNIISRNDYLNDTLFKEEETTLLINDDFMNDFMDAIIG
jgi:hypothetical protein